MLVPREFEEEFRAEVRAKTAQAIWVLTWIALCLYPPTTLLDLYFAPDRYTELSIVRWGTTGALAVLLVVLHIARKRGLLARHPRVFVWAFILLLCVSPQVRHRRRIAAAIVIENDDDAALGMPEVVERLE